MATRSGDATGSRPLQKGMTWPQMSIEPRLRSPKVVKSQLSPSRMRQGHQQSAIWVCRRWHHLCRGISDGLQEEGHLSWTRLGKWMGSDLCHSVSAY